MTKYASSDITSLTNAQCPTGGHQRVISNPKDVAAGLPVEYADERLVIDCPACEPLCIAKDSWSDDPTNIPLTKAEQATADKLEKEGMRQQATLGAALADLANERARDLAAPETKRTRKTAAAASK